MFTLKTKRLLIREFQLTDLEQFIKIMADPEVMRFSISGPLNREEASKLLQTRILEHYHQYDYGLWALVEQEQNCLIGFSGLIHQSIDQQTEVELGYRLLPAYWGKGLIMEANQTIVNYAFRQLGLSRLISIIDPHNEKSLATAKRIGMQFTKTTTFHGILVHIYKIESNQK